MDTVRAHNNIIHYTGTKIGTACWALGDNKISEVHHIDIDYNHYQYEGYNLSLFKNSNALIQLFQEQINIPGQNGRHWETMFIVIPDMSHLLNHSVKVLQIMQLKIHLKKEKIYIHYFLQTFSG